MPELTATLNNPSMESNTKNEKEEPAPNKPPPPPPEKPLPDDCCGSGCVRCVWDIYYDELEAYDKLYNADSSGSKPPR